MYIARLQLKGFKSFGDTYDMPLSPGMTAIVGPNGSGKSNLLDALRWVLGSHSSKLRVQKQGGLIFHGSVSRPQASEGEVGIQMRDGVKICTIRRRVNEQGTAVSVDGSRVTLADLDEVKRAWQLAGDRFAFIGQGEVAEVIQQRPGARRELLETLFGIDAYRKRRDEGQTRLDEAREEYGRLRAFSAELSARRDEIAPEVERAQAARDLMRAVEDDRMMYYWTRRRAAERELDDARAEQQRCTYRLASCAAWRAMWERALAYVDGGLSQLSGGRSSQIASLDEAKAELERVKRAAYSCGATLSSASRRLAQIEAERAETAERVHALRADRDRSTQEARALNDERAAKQASLDAARARHDEAAEAIEQARAEREQRDRAIGEIDGQMTSIKASLRSMGESLLNMKEGAAAPKSDPSRRIKRELDELERRHEELLGEQQRVAEEHTSINARLQNVTAELNRTRREATRTSSRLAELRDQATSEIYPRPVQHLLSASRLGRTKIKPAAVIDAFSCEPELATAIEAFLGARQFWLLVDTMDEAGELIEMLKKSSAGRATFLPLERAKPRSADTYFKLPTSGITGWAMELVRVDKKWRPALEQLMGDLLIVDEFATGQGLVRSGFRGPIATLDGDVFQPGGTVSGGRNQKPGRAIEIKSQLASMEAEAERLRSTVSKLDAEFKELEEQEIKAAERKDATAAEIRELSSRRSELDAERAEAQRERAREKSEREALMSSLRDGGRRLLELSERRAELAAPPEAETASTADASLPLEIERLTAELKVIDEKMRSTFVLSERNSKELLGLERAMNALDDEASERGREQTDSRASLAQLARRYAEAAKRRRTVEREMAEFAGRYERIVRSRDVRAARLDRAKAAETEAGSAAAEAEHRASALVHEIAELVQTWEDQFAYPGADGFPDADPEALRRSIKNGERRIRELGDVNMGALSEDEGLRDRLSKLGAQLDDVSQGMAELERLITGADEQARSVFVAALDEIDKKFNDMFKRLFTGGDAKLEFIEGDTLWDSGVDVVARPPGKHPQSISQLSGGEQSLSAIALLFASLEVARCPIAVLDEVDAALDEVNLRRFADLAKDASSERQIFVMTHRRVTMERADTLYGVTLAEPGLSQVIGVRIEDWA